MKKIFTSLFAGLFAVAVIIPTAANAQGKPAYKIDQDNTSYQVQPGDTMWKVSQKLNVDYGKLVQQNPQIANNSCIFPGYRISIPEDSTYDGNHADKGNAKGHSDSKGAPDKEDKADGNQQQDKPSRNDQQSDQDQGTGNDQKTDQHSGTPSDNDQPADSEQGNNNGQSSDSQKGNDNSQNDQSDQGISQFEQQVVDLTNQERTQHGLPELKVDNELANMAGKKAQDMIDNNYFDHNSPTYGSPFDMMSQFGISYTSAGENIAAGQSTPQEVVDGWMDSPGHRANILNEDYTYIGVGHVEGGSYGHYWVQEFIKK